MNSALTIVPFLYRVNDLILNPIILLAFAVSLVLFLYGLVRFLSVDSGDKGTTRAEARNSIMWGMVGMLIMFSVYGIIRLVLGTFGISGIENTPAGQFIK